MLEIFAIGIAISAFLLSCVTAYMSLCGFRYQLYLDFHRHYTTDEMDKAIKEIWKFARKIISENLKISKDDLKGKDISDWFKNDTNKRIFKNEYKDIVKYAEIIIKKENNKGEEFLTIRKSRRLVTQYYLHLTSAYFRSKFFSKRSFFDWYSPEDLIIFDMLIPLEEAEAERLNVNVRETKIKLRHFKKFREDCKDYYFELDGIDC